MLLIAKVALGMGAALFASGAYVFHEGVISVDVDESRNGGSHVHFWVPATVVPAGLHIAAIPQHSRHELERAAHQVKPYLPLLHTLAKELKNYPNVEFVDVRSENGEHVRISTEDGRIVVDAVTNEENVHVKVPIETIRDVANDLESMNDRD